MNSKKILPYILYILQALLGDIGIGLKSLKRLKNRLHLKKCLNHAELALEINLPHYHADPL